MTTMVSSAADVSEEHRHLCEVRYVAGMSSDDARRKYLLAVAAARGKDASARLRIDVWNLMKKQRSSDGSQDTA